MSPVQLLVQGLVGGFVAFDALQEIGHCFLRDAAFVVRAAQLHLLRGEGGASRFGGGYSLKEAGGGRVELGGKGCVLGRRHLTLMFSSMMAGSSQMDSTNRTCRESRVRAPPPILNLNL